MSHHAFDLLNFTQGDTESVEEFIHRVSQKATDMKVDGQKMMVRIMNGLKPKIRADLIRHNPTTMEELRTQASLAEFAQSLESETTAVQNATNATVCNAVSSLEERMQHVETININMVNMVKVYTSLKKSNR